MENIHIVYNLDIVWPLFDFYGLIGTSEETMEIAGSSPTRESDRVEVELREKILTLEIEPGMALSEASLIKRYGWGRTPLREAFQRLAEQSLLQIIPHHGVVVTPLSVFEFVEVMEAMAMVIGPAISLACKRLSAEDLHLLEQTLQLSQEAAAKGDFVTVANQDYEFHRILAIATGNRYLCQHLIHLHQVATRFNLASWKRDANAELSLSEHGRIIDALQHRDDIQARQFVLEHIENARNRVMGTFQH
jgi:DNA-binding GntR family transcriptional regulator